MSNDSPIYLNPPGRPRKKRRKGVKMECLKCRKIFLSKDRIYNRICVNCNEQNERLAPAAEGKFSDETGNYIFTGGTK